MSQSQTQAVTVEEIKKAVLQCFETEHEYHVAQLLRDIEGALGQEVDDDLKLQALDELDSEAEDSLLVVDEYYFWLPTVGSLKGFGPIVQRSQVAGLLQVLLDREIGYLEDLTEARRLGFKPSSGRR